MGKVIFGLEKNVAGLLCYILGWVSGLFFFLAEKDDKFIRFHAMQSMVVFGAISVTLFILAILRFIPYISLLFFVLYWIVWVIAVVLWIILMVKAYQGEKYKLPGAGDFAEKQI